MDMDPTLTAAATATLETSINTALAYDPASRLALQQLAGQSLAIEVSQPKLQLCLLFDADQVRVVHTYDHTDESPTTLLRGSLPALMQLAVGDNTTLADSGVEAFGSTALLTSVQQIARNLDIDWEEILCTWLGDVIGHQAAEQIRHRVSWTRNRLGSARRLLEEFLTEELRSTPTQVELNNFSQEVDQLRFGLDRAEARLRKLKQQLSAHHKSQP
ncbi:SCP2 sterol-binding domain-containing protein [Maricurvus nonylphenolicus]|uniref:ubiquinone biosynthesis accessory factor UbiJ n=1 Tax=Maricurvus nonylphenolicus TaxID=1008307 RepID=UPI0036F3534B